MTLYLDPESGDVKDEDGTVIGTADGPPYQIPDDVLEAVKKSFPSDHSSVSVNDLIRTLEASGGDVEFGTPTE